MKTLYKRTATGAIQTWTMELKGDSYRTIYGQLHGEQTTSEWTKAQPTNVGRSNARTAEEQASFEVDSHYTKKLEQGRYHEKIEDIDKPKFFNPMLAHKYEPRVLDFVRTRIFSQPKLDGVRCIATGDGLFSRNGKRITSVPFILRELGPLFDADPDLILDGELYNHTYKDDFNTLISTIRKKEPCKGAEDIVQYHVYDCPSANGNFGDRSHNLALVLGHYFQLDKSAIKAVETEICSSAVELDALYDKYLSQGYEGQIVRLDAPYQQKRSKNLLKRKEFKDEEFVVLDIEEGLGNWAGYAKRIKLQLQDGREFGAGVRGTQSYLKGVLASKDTFIGKHATVRYFELTPDGVPRFPVVTNLNRDD